MTDLFRYFRRALSVMLAPLFLSALIGTTLLAQTGTANVSLRGQVFDQTGALVPAVTVSVVTPSGTALVAQTNEEGRYVFRNLPPGTYKVQVNVPGFANFEQDGVVIATGQPQTVDAHLKLAEEKQQVTVQSDAPQVSISAESNASALVIKGKDLEALSDDPDELASDLQALAGPSAGPNGGQIYIDGFTGGQLPPKSSIREIRINQNPFAPEYDKLGYG